MFTSNYVPFGRDCDGFGAEEFKYTGKREDTSGLYYYGARFYDPETGRFITEDPVLGEFGDPQSLNRYVYCRNNPHKYMDPDGRWITIAVGVIIGFAIKGRIHLIRNPNDLKGPLVQGAIGGAAEAIAGATFGMGTMGASAIAGKATTMVALDIRPPVELAQMHSHGMAGWRPGELRLNSSQALVQGRMDVRKIV